MTEDEWRACEDPKRMGKFLGQRSYRRKQGLFAVACCRRIAGALRPTGLQAVNEAEACRAPEWVPYP